MQQMRRTIYARAAQRHGLVSRADLDALGVSRRQREVLAADGTLVAAGTQVFIVGGSQRTTMRSVAAACLDVDGVASHQTAAWLHGLPGFGPGVPPHVLIGARSARYRGGLATVHTTTNLPADDVLPVKGIPTLSVARTLMTLAAAPRLVSLERLRGAVDEAVRTGMATDAWLFWRLEELRCRGRNGVRRFEAVLQARAGGAVTESWLERELLRVLAAAGLPLPACQRRIEHEGAFVARVDFVYERQRVVVEALGHASHSSREALAADAARRNALQMAGYEVLEFTYDDIVRRPDEVIAAIRAALARSSRQTPPPRRHLA